MCRLGRDGKTKSAGVKPRRWWEVRLQHAEAAGRQDEVSHIERSRRNVECSEEVDYEWTCAKFDDKSIHDRACQSMRGG